jgi:adenylate kinase
MKKLMCTFFALITSAVFSLDPAILLIGPPGAGKGTFSQYAEKMGYCYLSTGDLLRNEVKKKTQFGLQIENIIKKGEFVDQKMLFALMKNKIEEFAAQKRPFIVDGYVRDQQDMDDFTGLLEELGLEDKLLVLKINSSDNTCLERIFHRAMCPECFLTLTVDKQHFPGAPCPSCLVGILQKRASDVPETIKNRLKTYRELDVVYGQMFPAYPFIDWDGEGSRNRCKKFCEYLLSEISSFSGTSLEFVKKLNLEDCKSVLPD